MSCVHVGRWSLIALCLTAIAATLVVTSPVDRKTRTPSRSRAQPGRPAPASLIALAGHRAVLPLSFEANEGQTDALVKFLARGSGFTLFLTTEGATLGLRRPSSSSPRASRPASANTVLGLKLLGANPSARVEGQEKLPGKSHYLLGRDRAKWRTHVSHYARVKYRDIYPGVDLVFYGNDDRLEYDFLVAPGADPSRIQVQLAGAESERIDDNGDLVVRLADTEIRQLRPVVYQDWDGSRHFLSGRYALDGTGRVGFQVAGYRADKALVIDPVLAYSSFLGGSDLDVGYGVAVDASDNVYLTGETVSTDFPTVNPEQPTNRGGSDAFVTKLDPTGTVVLFSTYLGGTGNENNFNSGVEASGIAVDAAGNACVTGRTSSIDFPVVNALFSDFRGGDYDAFVSKLSADGSTLLYSSYFGGEANDSGNGIAVDSGGNIYVTGGTRSQSDFPITPGAFQNSLFGQLDAFVAKIDPTRAGGASLVYSTFLGGGGIDRGTAIAVDAAGNAFVTGRTESPDFPIQNAYQAMYGGGADAFVTVLNPTGTGLVYSTFLGGNGLDVGNGIAVDTAGNAYICGETKSTDFPAVNGFQIENGGNSDAFVAQLDPTGAVLVYATYLGGSALDRATGIALDSTGKISITGETSSSNFPPVNAFQGTPGGGKDAFVARLDPSQQGAASLLYSSFLGDTGDDVGFGIALNSAGDAWVIGQTASPNFPTVNALQPAYGQGPSDAFVARISNATATPNYSVSAIPASLTVPPGGTANYTVTVSPIAGFTGSVDLALSGLPANAMASFTPPAVVITDATPQSSILAVSTATSTPVGTFPLRITATSGALQHDVLVTLVVTTDTTSADLAITKNGSSNPVERGSNLSYSIKAINQGPAVATGVTVTDPLPNAVFVSVTSSQGTCSGTSTVTCNIGTLAVGSMATVTIVVTPQAIGSLTNTATVAGDQPDPNPDNNSATVSTTVEASCPGPGPCMLDPNLSVNTIVSSLTEPTGIAFLGASDFLVLEKSTGRVKRVVDGVVQGVVLDLAVNSASERGLLGIALHPDFVNNGFVYLYWTCRGQAAADDCDSLYGDDTSDITQVPRLGNRVDRFFWDGSTLTLDQNVIRLHSYQLDADANGNFNQPPRGNHNGGKIVFGPDGQLYILIGDNGRRGNMQNILYGVLPLPPGCQPQDCEDDQFGGPAPDNAHFTGVIIRLNDDGSTPTDNPFFDYGAQVGGEVGANIQRIFAYGVRNSFGLAFDPLTGNLWNEENGDDSYDEINLITPGADNGWVQIMGPVERVADFKAIETSPQYFGLQQVRWPPTLIADTPDEALARLQTTLLPGAWYNDPRFSWKYAVAPSPIGFVNGPGLGPQYQGDMLVGAARTFLSGGYLFDFKLTADRSDLDLSADPRLADRVADNVDKFDITESESLLIGRDFGITTDIQTSPGGTVYVVSLTNGAVYEIFAPGATSTVTFRRSSATER